MSLETPLALRRDVERALLILSARYMIEKFTKRVCPL